MGVAVLTSSDAAWPWSNTGGQTIITAEAIGGGGGGGGENGYPAGGGGGKGGSYAKTVITKGAESTLNITVGAAGTAGSGGNGGNGGASKVNNGSDVLRAAGGQGGGGAATNNHSGAAGTGLYDGASGTTNVGDTTYAGGDGAAGLYTTPRSGGGGGSAGPTSAGGAASGITAGTAGTGTFGDASTRQEDGAAGRTGSENNGQVPNASYYGGGGSGGLATDATNHTGGAGRPGIVILTWVDIADPPTMSTEAASSVAEETATGNGTCSATGGANLDHRGFVWDTASHGDPGNVSPGSSGYAGSVDAAGSFGAESFTNNLTNLAPNQLYYYRSYGHNTGGYAYGDEEQFTTLNWAVRLKATANLTDGSATTRQLSYPGGKGAGDFEAGKQVDTTNPQASFDPGAEKFSEWEICVETIDALTGDGDEIQIRFSNAGTALDSYTHELSWIIGSGGGPPSLAGQLPLIGVGA